MLDQTLAHLAEFCALETAEGPSIDLDVPADLTLTADPQQFQRAIENLLRNASRYAASRVWLMASTSEAGIQVSVHDDGPGIPDSARAKVLQPLVRLDEDRG